MKLQQVLTKGLSMTKAFKERVSEDVIDLTRDQAAFFAWLCAVRSLPFIGASGNFNFWKEGDKFKFIYAIVNVIDTIAARYTATSTAFVTAVDTAICAANDAYAVFAVDTNKNRTAYAARAAADTARAVTIAARVANDDIITACIVVVAAARTVTPYANVRGGINLEEIICEDISYIKLNIYDKFNNDIGVYGDVWNNFQKALNDVGCDYWGRLYENIFENKFQIDKEALRLRLSVPQEIKEQGAKAVADYLEQMEAEGSEHLNEARIIILGEKGAGKTCLARRLINPDAPMTKLNESTEGVVSTIWKTEDKEALPTVNAHIWDFAGHVITHAAHRCFLSERCLYILVYDGRTERRNQIEYWLDHVKNYGGDAPVRILVNMFDSNKPDIPENTLKSKYPFITDFVYFSIDKDKDVLEKFRAGTSEFISNNPMWNSQKIPSSYYKVKNALGTLFDGRNSDNEHITKERFYTIASENGVKDGERENLLEVLHYLGVCLWYKDIKDFNMLVLNPDWISSGIYKTINWMHNNSKHAIVALGNYEDIFKDERERFPKDKFEFIFELMKKYELAYSKDNEQIIVPHLLRKDQPEKLPDFSVEDSLMIKYVSEQSLPPNAVCRLIVRHHEENRDDRGIWRYGIVLNYKKDTIALVRGDDRNIVITVKGTYKSEYIAKLRGTMNDILSSYKSDKPNLLYRLIVNEPVEILLSDDKIKNHIANRRNYYDDKADKDISLESTANIYNITIHVNEVHMGSEIIFNQKAEIGQLNSASGNATINPNQHNGIDPNRLNSLIEKLTAAFPKNASEGDKNDFEENIKFIKEESKSPKPRKNLLKNTLAALGAIKGTTEFAAAVTAIVDFFK
jgi:hypothetical protein